MTQEDKDLLLKDLCARLPYGVKCVFRSTQGDIPSTVVRIDKEAEMVIHRPDGQKIEYFYFIEDGMFKPYLRPLSSMTEEENKQRKELSILLWYNSNGERGFDGFGEISGEDVLKAVDWLNAHHFDYRGLIKRGLALEAPESMYKNEQHN